MAQLHVCDLRSTCNPKQPGTSKGFSVYTNEMRGRGRGKGANIFSIFYVLDAIPSMFRSITFSSINTFST